MSLHLCESGRAAAKWKEHLHTPPHDPISMCTSTLPPGAQFFSRREGRGLAQPQAAAADAHMPLVCSMCMDLLGTQLQPQHWNCSTLASLKLVGLYILEITEVAKEKPGGNTSMLLPFTSLVHTAYADT